MKKNPEISTTKDINENDQYSHLVLDLYIEVAQVASRIRRSIKGGFHEADVDKVALVQEIRNVIRIISHISNQFDDCNLQIIAQNNLRKTHKIYKLPLSDANITDISDYAQKTRKTYREDLPQTSEDRVRFFCMGLIKEVGKIAELFGEYKIDKKPLDIHKVQEKLGDALWYLTAILDVYELDLQQVLEICNEKSRETVRKNDEYEGKNEIDYSKYASTKKSEKSELGKNSCDSLELLQMTFENYQNETKNRLANYIKTKPINGIYIELILGLFEEAAEVVSLINIPETANDITSKGKHIGIIDIDIPHLEEELGDVFWYISEISIHLPGCNLETIAQNNLFKTHLNYGKRLKIGKEQNLTIDNYAKSTFDTYRNELPVSQSERSIFFGTGLIKEIGKLAELFGEHEIDNNILDYDRVQEKLGAALWYLVAIAHLYKLKMPEITKRSIEKVKSRYTTDGIAIKGEHDDIEQ